MIDIKEILNEINSNFKSKLLKNKKCCLLIIINSKTMIIFLFFSYKDLDSKSYTYFSDLNSLKYKYIAFYYLQIINYLL